MYMYYLFTDVPPGFQRLIIDKVNRLSRCDRANVNSESNQMGACIEGAKRQSIEITDAEIFDKFDYKGPLEKELAERVKKLDQANEEREELLAKLESYSTFQSEAQAEDDLEMSSYKCSRCHIRANHRKNRCPNEKCESFFQCRVLKLHPAESKEVETLRAKSKKALKPIKTLESEIEKLKATLDSQQRSFTNRIRCHLIRSNVDKYLVKKDGKLFPCTRVINIDATILQAHYNNVVPVNLEAEREVFAGIIREHHKKYAPAHHAAEGTIEAKLSAKLAQLSSPSKFSNLIDAVNKPLQRLLNRGEPQLADSQGDIARRVVRGERRMQDLNREFGCTTNDNHVTSLDGLSPKSQAFVLAKQANELLESFTSPSKKKIRHDYHRPSHRPPTCTYTPGSYSQSITPKGRSGNATNARQQLFSGSIPPPPDRYFDYFENRQRAYGSEDSASLSDSASSENQYMSQRNMCDRSTASCYNDENYQQYDSLPPLHRQSIVNKILKQKSAYDETSTPQSAHATWHTPKEVKEVFNIKPPKASAVVDLTNDAIDLSKDIQNCTPKTLVKVEYIEPEDKVSVPLSETDPTDLSQPRMSKDNSKNGQ